jgi:hypothetical protein
MQAEERGRREGKEGEGREGESGHAILNLVGERSKQAVAIAFHFKEMLS